MAIVDAPWKINKKKNNKTEIVRTLDKLQDPLKLLI